MIVSIVDHGGARRRTKATAATVEALAEHEHDRHAGEEGGDPAGCGGWPSAHRAGRPSRSLPCTCRRATEKKNRSRISRLIRLFVFQLDRDEQVDAAADEADQDDDRDARQHELVAGRRAERRAATARRRRRPREGTANSATVTAAAGIASTTNGVPVSNRSATTPANTGPIVNPYPWQRSSPLASAPVRRSSDRESESHDAPAPRERPATQRRSRRVPRGATSKAPATP